MQHAKTLARSAASLMAMIAMTAPASADIITRDDAQFDFTSVHMTGFESFAAGAKPSTILFGEYQATVSFIGRSPLQSEIIHRNDGYGAVAHEGDRFWKLRADGVKLDFGDQQLSQFGFSYSDLEWADLTLRFETAGTYVLSDRNPNQTDFFAFTAAPGESFSSLTIEWSRDTDGVGFDNMFFAPVPAPAPLSLAAIAGLTALRRRR